MNKNSPTMKGIDSSTMVEGMALSAFFAEMELFTNADIRAFVREVLVKYTPSYFWTIPASTSGKFHHEDECKEGGRVRHVKRAVRLGVVIMKGLGWFGHAAQAIKEEHEYEYNIVIAALLLHDIFSSGIEGRERKRQDGSFSTCPLHPYYVREKLKLQKYKPDKEKDDEEYMYKLPYFDDIMTAIEGHYGFWSMIPKTAELEHAQSPAFICYMSDFIASRKLNEWFEGAPLWISQQLNKR